MYYILSYTPDGLRLIDNRLLLDYIISDTDIQYIENLSADSTILTADLQSDLIAKIGPGAANKQTLNSLYVQINNNQGFRTDDLTNFKKFIKHNLVGHVPVDVTTLNLDEISE